MLMPVVLPPGRASDATSPCPTMSSVKVKIGMVRVATCAARAAAAPPATMASTCALTSSAATGGKLLGAHRISTTIHDQVLAFDKT